MSLKKHFVWNLIGGCAPLVIGVFSIPFLMRELGVQLFGLLTLIWALIGYFSLFDFGLGRALTQIISKYIEDEIKCEEYASIGLLLIFYIGFVGLFIVCLLTLLMPYSWIGVSNEYQSDVRIALLLASIGIPITTLTSGIRGVLEGFFKFKESNILRLYLGVGNFILPVIVVFFFEKTLSLVTASLILVRLFVLFLSLYEVKKCVKLKLYSLMGSKDKVKELISFGSWMTASNVISPLMVTADRFVISALLGATVIAYYTVPFEVIIRFLIIPAALTSAFFPHISRAMSTDLSEAKKMYHDKYKIIVVSMLIICGVAVSLSKFMLSVWLGNEFASHSWVIASILMFGVTLNGIAQMPHAATQASGDSKSIAIAHIIEFIIYIPILMGMITYFGLIGAAVAWVFRAGLDLLFMSILSNKSFRVSN
ncbi:MAG: flippase [Plesiomonas sp.]|nr:flippase [Plesiomonas sp.]